jgi:hypothetical protein
VENTDLCPLCFVILNCNLSIQFPYPTREHIIAQGTENTPSEGNFVDSRDGNTFKWVKIENIIWMIENLRYNGYDAVPYN